MKILFDLLLHATNLVIAAGILVLIVMLVSSAQLSAVEMVLLAAFAIMVVFLFVMVTAHFVGYALRTFSNKGSDE